jgi:hypothetical protein
MWKGILPVGSIVLLKDGDRKLMIAGCCVTKDDDETRVYDYAGVLYPDGLESLDHLYLFNEESIEQVYYVGYMDDNSREFFPNIEKMLESARKSGAHT